MKKIKSITGYTAFIGEDGIPENQYKSFYQEFDINQNIIKDVIYTGDGEIETASGYKFNESNILIEEIHYLNETDVAERLVYKSNNNGDLSEIETTYSDGSKTIKKINRNGQVLSVVILDEDNKLEGEEIRKFDEQGNVLEEVIYNENKNIKQKSLYEYDSKGQLINKTEFGENEDFVIRKTFDYNNKGYMIKKSHFSEHGKLINVVTAEYNEEGELILQQYDNKYLIKITYDDKNRKIKDETMNLSNNLVEALKVYEYDENDFLIEEISYEMGQQYELGPGVLGRTNSNYMSTKHQYQFY